MIDLLTLPAGETSFVLWYELYPCFCASSALWNISLTLERWMMVISLGLGLGSLLGLLGVTETLEQWMRGLLSLARKPMVSLEGELITDLVSLEGELITD